MKIAVTYADGLVYQHFGHAPAFKIYEVRAGEILSEEVLYANGSGHGALAGLLAQLCTATAQAQHQSRCQKSQRHPQTQVHIAGCQCQQHPYSA